MATKTKTYGSFSTRGGSERATTAANKGAILVDIHQKTRLIDADPQQSLSRIFPITTHSPHGPTQLYKSASPAGGISSTEIRNLDIVMNDDPKGEAITHFLRESVMPFQHLYEAIQALQNKYDCILTTRGVTQESVVFTSAVLLSHKGNCFFFKLFRVLFVDTLLPIMTP